VFVGGVSSVFKTVIATAGLSWVAPQKGTWLVRWLAEEVSVRTEIPGILPVMIRA